MSAAKRVLFLGITGVGKSSAMEKLAKLLDEQNGLSPRIIKFEEDYLWNDPNSDLVSRNSHVNPADSIGYQRAGFLDSDLHDQAKNWNNAWSRFIRKEKRNIDKGEPIFLGLHGCFTREHYGTRCVFDPRKVAEAFRPDIIFTLINDVYEMWWRTEYRAGGYDSVGRPTLEQLLFARRHELIVGDLIALSCSEHHSPVKNLMFSVHHPLKSFSNCIIRPKDRQIVYLSFPISQPRMLEKNGDLTAKKEVSAFIKDAYEKQNTNPRLVLECPLGIDELPFTRIRSIEELAIDVQKAKENNSTTLVDFDRDKLRWNMDEFWAQNIRMGAQVPQGAPFHAEQLLCARGSLETDVSWRDYRLVDQADFVIVFNPIYCNRSQMAGSVRLEAERAAFQQKYVYIYQDPLQDEANAVWTELGVPIPGSDKPQMVPHPQKRYYTVMSSRDELLQKLDKGE